MIYIRTAFFLTIFIFSALNAASGMAQALFTVDNIRVDITADNALKARDQAFEQAQIKAFKVMANKLKDSGEIDSFTMPKPSVISSLVQDYEITNEKLSAVRYIGTYTFRFRENATRRILIPQSANLMNAGIDPNANLPPSRYNSPYSSPYPEMAPAMAAGDLLILPFYETAQGKILLWSDQNTWMNAWTTARALNGPVNVRVPIGDLQDVKDISGDEVFTYDREGLHRIMQRYNTQGAIIAIAGQSRDALHIDIYKPQQPRPSFIQRINVNISEGNLQAGAMNLAVLETFQYLQKNGSNFVDNARAQNLPSQPNTLYVRVPFTSPREWAETQNVLRSVPVIKNINVKSLSPKSAYVELTYEGTQQDLQNALTYANLDMQQTDGTTQGGMTELRLNRYGTSYIQRF